MSGSYLDDVWRVPRACLEGVRMVLLRYLEGFSKVSGMCLSDDWKVSGRCKGMGLVA